MDVLVVGANGLLGSNVVAASGAAGWDVTGTYHTTQPSFDIETHQLDIRETDRFRALLETVTPDAVVNCAAMTDVDGCEAEEAGAMAVNAEAPRAMAAATADAGIAFVHVSTDYVFDGERSRPYTESDEPNPVQAYGRSKLAGERAVADVAPRATTLRLSFVYGRHGATGEVEGFPAWVLDRFEAGEPVPLFTDQRMTPTRARQAATVVVDLLRASPVAPLFHVTSRDAVTPHEFGQRLAAVTGGDPALVRESSMDDLDRPARRPRDSTLDSSRLAATLGRPQPTLEADIEALFGRGA